MRGTRHPCTPGWRACVCPHVGLQSRPRRSGRWTNWSGSGALQPVNEEEMTPMADDSARRDEEKLAELGYKQDLDRVLELVLELRDLVHDHLGAGGVLHDLSPGLQQRRPDRDLVGLADHLRAHPHRGVLDVRARLGLPHRRRPVLVGGQARRSRLVLVHGLVQRHRALRCRRLGRLRLRDVRGQPFQPLGPEHHRQLLGRRPSSTRSSSCSWSSWGCMP